LWERAAAALERKRMGEGASPSPIIIFGESLNALSRSKSDFSDFDHR
jgi:hypothetical protein